MIKKALITTIVLFTFYSILVTFIIPRLGASQHQWQENVVKAEKYLYNKDHAFKDVIIGSSLSCHLVMDSLPLMYNLSFAGLSIYDGLNIIMQHNMKPKRIFIEMNVTLKKEDNGFVKSIFSPVIFYSKNIFTSLRGDKQPIAIFGDFCLTLINRIKPDRPITARKNDDLYLKMLQMQITDNSKEPDTATTNYFFERLHKYIATLNKEGISIVFFEMPVDERLCGLPMPNRIRALYHQYFDDDKFKYIPLPPCSSYTTTDGVHLDKESGLKYTKYFKLQIMKL